jgi:hypothetical protein
MSDYFLFTVKCKCDNMEKSNAVKRRVNKMNFSQRAPFS